jgi:tRNA(Ile)-lysidine synthase
MSKSDFSPIEQRVLKYIRRQGLIQPAQTLLVAVSGGADSVCLLHLLYRLHGELRISLQVAHLNHQLRGPESDRDAGFVSDLAQQLGLPATIQNGDVRGFQSLHHLSLEEAARAVRYHFLAETARAGGAASVAVGHTQNDQVETILLHILRGAGTLGLQGLRPSHAMRLDGGVLSVVRPLLEISRAEVEEYCRANGLAFCQDSSNLSPAMLRNRVRLELLPRLAEYNPDIAGALVRISRIARDESEFLEAETAELWERLTARQGSNLLIDKAAFLTLPAALQRQILRRAFNVLLGSLKDIETRHIESLLAMARQPAGRRLHLPGKLVFSVEYCRFILGQDVPALIPFPALPVAQNFHVPGSSRLDGWTVQAEIRPVEEYSADPESRENWQKDGFNADFDQAVVGSELSLRSLRPGDVFQPLGLTQTKKVARFMLDARIPHDWRSRVPLVCNERQIIWVAGWRPDERVKVTPATTSILRLKLIKQP